MKTRNSLVKYATAWLGLAGVVALLAGCQGGDDVDSLRNLGPDPVCVDCIEDEASGSWLVSAGLAPRGWQIGDRATFAWQVNERDEHRRAAFFDLDEWSRGPADPVGQRRNASEPVAVAYSVLSPADSVVEPPAAPGEILQLLSVSPVESAGLLSAGVYGELNSPDAENTLQFWIDDELRQWQHAWIEPTGLPAEVRPTTGEAIRNPMGHLPVGLPTAGQISRNGSGELLESRMTAKLSELARGSDPFFAQASYRVFDLAPWPGAEVWWRPGEQWPFYIRTPYAEGVRVAETLAADMSETGGTAP